MIHIEHALTSITEPPIKVVPRKNDSPLHHAAAPIHFDRAYNDFRASVCRDEHHR